jgi:hypothetical protein
MHASTDALLPLPYRTYLNPLEGDIYERRGTNPKT